MMTIINDTIDPMKLFQHWWYEAREVSPSILPEPDACNLATCNYYGHPSSRMVLLKNIDAQGFVFYTNLQSRKGIELLANPHVALCFYWMPLTRQVRIEGIAELVSATESETYFASRSRESQISAWASQQSQPLVDQDALKEAYDHYAVQFGTAPITRPNHWQGVRVIPLKIEFWQEGPHRLHQRDCFSRANINTPWHLQLLSP